VPGASRSEIAGILGDRLKVRVAAPPEAGKANRALLDLLRTWLGVREVEIVAGRSVAEKTVRVRGLSSIPDRGEESGFRRALSYHPARRKKR